MTAYILRRCLMMIPIAFGVTIVVFLFIRIAPGDVASFVLGGEEGSYTQEEADALRAELGLDAPLWKQYATWVGDALQGDLGRSLFTGRSVNTSIAERGPVTLELTVLALAVATIAAIPAGVLAAYRRGRPLDVAIRFTAVLMFLPSFWIATLLILVGLIIFSWAPPFRYVALWEDPRANLEQMILPVLVLAMNMMAVATRLTRNSVIDALNSDYVRTARAKGLAARRVAFMHALPNALLPITTVLGIQVGSLLSGTAIVEQVFNIKGLGTLLLEGIAKRDYVLVQSLALLSALVVSMVNLLVDVVYAFIDPRVKFGSTQ